MHLHKGKRLERNAPQHPSVTIWESREEVAVSVSVRLVGLGEQHSLGTNMPITSLWGAHLMTPQKRGIHDSTKGSASTPLWR